MPSFVTFQWHTHRDVLRYFLKAFSWVIPGFGLKKNFIHKHMNTNHLYNPLIENTKKPSKGTSRAKYQRDWRAKQAAAKAEKQAKAAETEKAVGIAGRESIMHLSNSIQAINGNLGLLSRQQCDFNNQVIELFGKMRVAFVSLHADVKAVKEKMNAPKDGGAW
jgi:hypothetical protein